MTPIEPVSLSFGAALLLGLSFGAGPCTIACLPYLGPVFTASRQGVGSAWRTLLPFSLGRLMGYTLLGSLAGWAGVLVQDWIQSPWVHWLLGGATLIVAFTLLFRNPGSTCTPREGVSNIRVDPPVVNHSPSDRSQTLPSGLFLMGMGMALNPCAPLSTIILAAATTASLLAGMSLGIGFGLGAILIPTLVFIFGVAHFSDQLAQHLGRWQRALRISSVGLLMLMGVLTMLGKVTP